MDKKTPCVDQNRTQGVEYMIKNKFLWLSFWLCVDTFTIN